MKFQLYAELQNYKSFLINGDMYLFATINRPCNLGNLETEASTELYYDQIVFIQNAAATSDLLPDSFTYVKQERENKTLFTLDNGTIITAFADAPLYAPKTYKFVGDCNISITVKGLCTNSIVSDAVSYDRNTYRLINLFAIGELSKKQRQKLNKLYYKLSGNSYDNYFSCSTIYYTDTGYIGLWDYQKQKPITEFSTKYIN